MSKKKIGIDFGTTYSSISYIDDNGILKYFDLGKKTFPSIAATIINKPYVLFGKQAEDQVGNWDTLFRGFKVLLVEEDEDKLKELGYTKDHNPQSMTKQFLVNMLKKYRDAEKIYSLEAITLTIPAIWKLEPSQSRSITVLKSICEKAVYEVFTKTNDLSITLLEEPSAAALYCANEKINIEEDYKLLVVDNGGGTIDVTLCEVYQENDKPVVEIKTSPWGAGLNSDLQMGKAGLYFQQKVIENAYKNLSGGKTPVMNAAYWEAIFKLENILRNGFYYEEKYNEQVSVDERLQKVFFGNKKPSDKVLDTDIGEFKYEEPGLKNDGMIRVTLGLLYEAFDNEIKNELDLIFENEEKTGVLDYIRQEEIDIESPNKFKLVLVGGFNNFYLARKYIYNKLNLNENIEDNRIVVLSQDEISSAVAYGAAYKANGSIHKFASEYSLGIVADRTLDSEYKTVYWAIRRGEIIEPHKERWISSYDAYNEIYGEPLNFLSTGVKHLAIQYYDTKEQAVIVPIADDLIEEFLKNNKKEDKRHRYKIGFVFDESGLISIISQIIEEKHNENDIELIEKDIHITSLGAIGDIQGLFAINDFHNIREEL